MKEVLTGLAVPAVIGGYWLLFKWVDARKRARERLATDALKLARRDLRATVTAPQGADALAELADELASWGARFTVREPDQWIAYLGLPGGDVQFRGIERFTADDLPLRVAAYRTAGGLTLLVDEDFGWHLFVGPAKRRFTALYGEAIDDVEARVRAHLGI